MYATPAALTGTTSSRPFDFDEPRAQALHYLTLMLAALAWTLNVATLVASDSVAVSERTFVISLWLMVVAGCSRALLGCGITLATTCLAAGLTVAVGALVVQNPGSPVAGLFALVVIAVATVAGPRHGVAWAAITSLAAGLAGHYGGPVAREAIITTLALIWGSAFVSWLGFRSVRFAAEWAWSSYVEALEKTGELRERQGELNRVLKSLREAYDKLEQVSAELERARGAAEQARQLKAQFAANISHELRTPLNLILGFAEMMVSAPHTYGGEVLPVPYRGDIGAIQRNARHLSSLIDDVLDLSQVDAGRMGLSKEWVGLAEVAGEAARAVEAMFAHKGLSLTLEVPPNLPPVYVDRARLRQVFVNLLSNAARFTESGGAVVSAACQGDDLVVTVADTGVGIAPDDLPKVFEEFRQLDESIRRRHGGTGLGLSISKRFVELHGGAMWVESRLGKGTTFYFSIPLCQNVASETLRRDWETWARLSGNYGDRAPTVIVLTEDPSVARLLQRYLEGYRVVPAADANEATRLLAQVPANAVVAVDAEESRGEQRLRQLRDVPAGIPLIACSLPGHRQASERMGVVDYLLKPVSRERLAATLARLGPQVRRLLVVDDDTDMVRLLSQMIHAASPRYKVLRAYSGDVALSLLEERRPDALMLDLSIPGMDGYRLLERMKEMPELVKVPVVVITARDYDLSGAECRVTTITREGGLGIGDLMVCLKGALDGLLARPHPSPGTAPELRAVAAG